MHEIWAYAKEMSKRRKQSVGLCALLFIKRHYSDPLISLSLNIISRTVFFNLTSANASKFLTKIGRDWSAISSISDG